MAGLVRAGMPLKVAEPKGAAPGHEECLAKIRRTFGLDEADELAWNMEKQIDLFALIPFRFWYGPALLSNFDGERRVDFSLTHGDTNEYLAAIWYLKQGGDLDNTTAWENFVDENIPE